MWDAPGTHDVVTWQRWMQTVARLGPTAGYRDIVLNQRGDYPPISVGLLWLSSSVTGGASVLALKALLTACWLTSLALLAVLGPAFWVWFVYAALTLYSSLALGYLDVLVIPFVFAAAVALRKKDTGRFDWAIAGTLVAVSLAVKWQPLLWLPFIGVALWKESQSEPQIVPARDRVAAFGSGFLLVALAVAAWYGPLVCLQSLRLAFRHVALSPNALNLAWVVQDLAHRLAPETYGPLADGLRPIIWAPGTWLSWPLTALRITAYGICVLLAALSRQHRRQAIARAAALGCLSYFFLGTGVHENHLFPAVIVLLLLACYQESSRRVFAVIAVFQAINLAVFYGLDGTGLSSFREGPGVLGGLPAFRRFAGIDVALVFACIGVALFVWTWTELSTGPWKKRQG